MSVEIKKFFFLVAALVLMSCSSDDDDLVHCDATDSCSEDSSGKNTEPDQNSVEGEDEIDPDRAECYSKAYPFQSTMNVKALWPAQYYDASASGLAYATLDYTTCDSVSLKSVGLKVTQLSTGKSDSVPAVFVRDNHSPRKLYFGGDASVRLDTVWGEALPFANGDYLFEWDFVLESYVDDEIRESHARHPLRAMVASGFFETIQLVSVAVMMPATAARFVVTRIQLVAFGSPERAEPALNPHQPNQSMNTPTVASGMLWAGMA